MTLANIITTLRLILTIPFLIVLAIVCNISHYIPFTFGSTDGWYFGVGEGWENFSSADGLYAMPIIFISYIILALMDILDGYLARKRNEISNYGKLLDPIADKVLVSGTLLVLSFASLLPIWFTILVILRDLWITALRYFVKQKTSYVAAAAKVGKYKTVVLNIVVLLYIFPYSSILNAVGSESIAYNLFIYLPIFLLLTLYIATVFVITSLVVYSKSYFNILRQNHE